MNYNDNQLNMWNDLPPALNNKDSIGLIKIYRETGDKKIKDQIIFGNMRLVASYIKNYGASIYRISSANDFEDVAQEATIAVSNAIENYDLNKEIKFTTFVCVCVKNMFHNKFRKVKHEKNVCSLNEQIFDNDYEEYIDILEDPKENFAAVEANVEYKFLNDNILSLLSKKERDVYNDFYIQGYSTVKIAIKHGVSRFTIHKLLDNIKEKITNAYTNGVTDFDRATRGVRPTAPQEKRIKENLAILKHYKIDFLRMHFVPMLFPNQAKIFESLVLNYYGQSCKYLESTLKVSSSNIFPLLKSAMKKFKKCELDLLKEQRYFVPQPNKNQKQINFANKVVCEFNGKMFLHKYFVSVLPEIEKRVFSTAILDYFGQDYAELAKQCNLSSKMFAKTLVKTLKKLRSFDFDVAVDIIDNADLVKKTIETLTLEEIEQTKARMNLIKNSGGVLKVKRTVLPHLSPLQEKIAQDLYLHPKYNNIKTFAEENKLSENEVIENEKEFVDKFLVK